ncbi:hypothetical protein AB4343_18215 [Vibrio breoganii]|uniref:Uncharacterized protein n=1 Tax=Vibrio breoganii TaxID=553239 RepID=A0AAP8MYT3_9VIBR|nr:MULTISPECIES: hypothetical protein [Vibrio]NMR71974.1 hypothetical protein [Vibrio breoganii]OCH72088.1 hypothetical protein A6D95_17690 [Vibrio breoganii]OED96459.1 hypothetical protein A1QG_14380 [Vibrio breoganii ZF-29]OEF82517.1 hypothetical protein B003_10095 [Vibrio breoganii 1C10]PMF92818.1 hypothetical protein BCV08_11615 [Vibrio breoganii]
MKIKPIKIGVLLSLITILFGYGLGCVFGAANSTMKAYFHDQVYVVHASNFDSVKDQDTAFSKAKDYIKRAHLHSAAMGTASLATILALGFCNISDKKKKVVSTITGLGAAGYGVFVWTLMAFVTPIIGKSAAHETIAALAIPTGLALVFGTALTIYYVFTSKD